LADSIFHNGNPPLELLKFHYRKLFHLSAAQLEQEPIDDFFTNLLIYGYIKEKQKMEMEKNK